MKCRWCGAEMEEASDHMTYMLYYCPVHKPKFLEGCNKVKRGNKDVMEAMEEREKHCGSCEVELTKGNKSRTRYQGKPLCRKCAKFP